MLKQSSATSERSEREGEFLCSEQLSYAAVACRPCLPQQPFLFFSWKGLGIAAVIVVVYTIAVKARN